MASSLSFYETIIPIALPSGFIIPEVITAVIFSLFLGALSMWWWLRARFDLLTAPEKAEVLEIFEYDFGLAVRDFTYPIRFKRGRFYYLLVCVSIYLGSSLLGVYLITIRRAEITYLTPASVPLVLAVILQALLTHLPHKYNPESWIRRMFHGLIGAPSEAMELMNDYYATLMVGLRQVSSADGPEERNPTQMRAAQQYVYDAVATLASRCRDMPLELAEKISDDSYDKVRTYIQAAEEHAQSLQTTYRKISSDKELLDDLKTTLRRVLLGVGCLSSSTPSEDKHELAGYFRLPVRDAVAIVPWHKLLSYQLLVLVGCMIVFVASGGAIAQMINHFYNAPALPRNSEEAIYSWLLPEGTPLLLAYLVLFAVLADKSSQRPSRPENFSHATKVAFALFLTYLFILAARSWWSLASSEPEMERPIQKLIMQSVILTLSSVGTAFIANIAQKYLVRKMKGETSKFIIPYKILYLCLGIAVSAIWNLLIGYIYLQKYGERDEYGVLLDDSRGFLIMAVVFPCYVVLAILAGTAIIGASSPRKNGG